MTRFILALGLLSTKYVFAAPFIHPETEHLLITPQDIPENGILRVEHFERLKTLSFSEGNFSGLRLLKVDNNIQLSSLTLPEGLISLQRLEIMHLPELRIIQLPKSLTSLQVLKISANPRIPFLAVPETLAALQRLSISSNAQLETVVIPGSLNKLQILNIDNNTRLLELNIPDGLTGLRRFACSCSDNLRFLTMGNEDSSWSHLQGFYLVNALHLRSLSLSRSIIRRSHDLSQAHEKTPAALAQIARSLWLGFDNINRIEVLQDPEGSEDVDRSYRL